MRAIKHWFWVLAVSWAAITPVMSQDSSSTQSPGSTSPASTLPTTTRNFASPTGAWIPRR